MQVPAVHLQGQGCSSCFGNKKVTIDEFYKHVKDLHNNFYSYENDFSNMRNKITVICPNHGKFKQKAQSHYNGRRCQKCAKAGFDKNKNSYFYVQEIYNDNHLICYKYGITNKTPETRLKKQSYKTKYKQIIMFSIKGSGDYIYNLEKIIKNKFKYHKLLKEEFGDGYTETLELSSINLLEDIILEYILNN